MMNISNVSFGAKNSPEVFSWVNDNNKKLKEQTKKLERTPNKDQYSRTTAPRKRKSVIPVSIKAFTAGIAATLLAGAGVNQLNKPDSSVTIPYDTTTSISELADTYDVSEDAILLYNNIDDESELLTSFELTIPSSFDYLQEEIDSLQEKLYNDSLSSEKRAEIEEKIEAYSEKQALQESIATVYSDGKYVYYSINELDEESTSEEVYNEYKDGINVEVFKDIFDIKDGAIKNNNDISYSTIIEVGPEDDPDTLRDYSTYTIKPGDIIKVPVSAVKTNNITLDY